MSAVSSDVSDSVSAVSAAVSVDRVIEPACSEALVSAERTTLATASATACSADKLL